MNLRRFPATTVLVLTAATLAVGACAAPSATATAAPSTPPLQATPASSETSTPLVTLENATGNDVSIDIVDESGTLRSAISGTPGDGASVEPYTVTVANEGPTTLRLTWVGGPCDAQDLLAIDATGRRFLLVQPECPGDGVVFDRVLVLGFAEPIDAGDVEAILQDGLDTSGG
jgi:hypothetical protein